MIACSAELNDVVMATRMGATNVILKPFRKTDIDLAVELDPSARVGLFRLMGLQRRLSEILGRSVDLVPEPAENPRLRQNIERDRRRAF